MKNKWLSMFLVLELRPKIGIRLCPKLRYILVPKLQKMNEYSLFNPITLTFF